MQNIILEFKVTAKTSISHNSFQQYGPFSAIRRESFIVNGKEIEIPIISGNSVRGQMRDIASQILLTKENNEVIQVDNSLFHLLFSGGSLQKSEDKSFDVAKAKEIREKVGTISIFGGAIGNNIMPGKMQIGKLIPICQESKSLIPSNFFTEHELPSMFDITQIETYARRDDTKKFKKFLSENSESEEENSDEKSQQMMFNVETFKTGTQFFWKIVLSDFTDDEMTIFAKTLQQLTRIGGNYAKNFGEIDIQLVNKKQINDRKAIFDTDFVVITTEKIQQLQDDFLSVNFKNDAKKAKK